jgi:RNA polymerase sigma-70 factor, ECF subfamily
MFNNAQHSAPAATLAAHVDVTGAGHALFQRAFGAAQKLREVATDKTSDAALIARIADGDRQALRLLFARHQQKVHCFVLRLVANDATAEDIVNDVFLDLWRQAASFEGRARVSTWLLAIARNKALSAMRGRTYEPLDEAMAETIPDSADTAEDSLDASQRGKVLRQCLRQLSPAHREIIDLVYYHERSVEEVATILDVPAATVKTRMFYARKRLAELLKAAGIDTASA